ncbi:Pirin [Yarrowia sp. C11]|nr:Pirin [Yarrowia sp. C11]KAG5364125.1 Pirin [Yarrowia sp. E02]
MSTTTTATITTMAKTIDKLFTAPEQSEGVGARVRRAIGTHKLRNFNPFIMFDHFKVPSTAGFPDHPHRGQETITYVIKGSVDHEDFTGSKGTLNAGDLQFMTAGRGIVHAEMPAAGPNGETQVVEGIQLWVDLPAHLKDCEPRYRDLKAEEIPEAHSENKDLTVKVISGQALGVDSVKDLAYTPVWYLDYFTEADYNGEEVSQTMPTGFNSLLYVMKGYAIVNGQVVSAHDVATLSQQGDTIDFTPGPDSRVIIIGAQVLDQKIVQHGPFVATSQEGIMNAFMDYQYSSNGFERAATWQSEIGKRMM